MNRRLRGWRATGVLGCILRTTHSPTRHLARLRAGATIATATLLLAPLTACSEDEPKPNTATSPPAKATERNTSETADEPAAWEEQSKNGASAFVDHWLDVFNRSRDTGDTRELRRLSTDECVTCKNFAERTERIYDDGGFVRSDGWTVETLGFSGTSAPGQQVMALNVSQPRSAIKESRAAKVERAPAGRVPFIATVHWERGSWRLHELAVQE